MGLRHVGEASSEINLFGVAIGVVVKCFPTSYLYVI